MSGNEEKGGPMRVVLFNWRDLDHPKAGGAEVATHTLAKGLAARGHDIQWFTSSSSRYPFSSHRDGYEIIRRGTELTCRLHAAKWLLKNRRAVDVVIDEVNTLPFFSPLICRRRVVLWMHQLAREVWLLEAPLVIGMIGFITERAMLRIYAGSPAITVSQSSARSMRDYGYIGNISVIENALLPPVSISRRVICGRIGYVGRLTPSKRVDHIISAFADVCASHQDAELVVIGTGRPSYEKRLRRLAADLDVADRVHFMGRLSDKERDDVVRTLDLLLMTSVREGWGLVVSEAARYGVPSVVYPVDGLCDSVVDGRTGLIARSQHPRALADAALNLIRDRAKRNIMGKNAMTRLLHFSEERFVERFEAVLSATAVCRA